MKLSSRYIKLVLHEKFKSLYNSYTDMKCITDRQISKDNIFFGIERTGIVPLSFFQSHGYKMLPIVPRDAIMKMILKLELNASKILRSRYPDLKCSISKKALSNYKHKKYLNEFKQICENDHTIQIKTGIYQTQDIVKINGTINWNSPTHQSSIGHQWITKTFDTGKNEFEFTLDTVINQLKV